MNSRARKIEDKAARRASILKCARSFLIKKPYPAISLEAIARKVGLTKGALYLYFPSREALFFEVLSEDVQAWFDGFYARLDGAETWTPQQVADLLLFPGEAGLALLPILHSTLERNVSFETVKAFKELLLRRTVESAERLERKAPFIPPGTGVRFLVCAHAILVGFRQLADRSPMTERALALPHLVPLRADLLELRDVLTAVLAGWGAQSGAVEKPKRSATWKRKSQSRSSASVAGFPGTFSRTATSTAS
jgi:AcrR family transcriptional regulator